MTLRPGPNLQKIKQFISLRLIFNAANREKSKVISLQTKIKQTRVNGSHLSEIRETCRFFSRFQEVKLRRASCKSDFRMHARK
jgi:hypothetical protein